MEYVIYYALMSVALAVVLVAWCIAVQSGRREKRENEAFKRHLMIVVQRRDR